jgi:hypothetical protein
MAKISFSGTDELIATLQKANAFDDETQQELLYAAGDIIVEELQKMVKASGFQTEAYASSVKYRKTIKQDKNGDPYITITAVGKNEHGTRRAAVLFVLNYGRAKEYGQITGTYFWTKGVRSAQKRVNAELEKILTQKLKERGLL